MFCIAPNMVVNGCNGAPSLRASKIAMLCTILSYAHQFYISITYIRHNPGTQVLSVRVKLFINDLEEAIYQEQNVRIGLWKDDPIENAETYVEQYIASKLSIMVNGKKQPLQFLSQTIKPAEVLEDNVLICQLEAQDVPEISKLKVHNSIITETIDSQTNIININIDGKKKVINLDRILPEDEVSF